MYRYPLFLETFVEEAVLSPSHILGSFVKNQLCIAAWIHIWVFYSVLLVFMSVFVPVPCTAFEEKNIPPKSSIPAPRLDMWMEVGGHCLYTCFLWDHFEEPVYSSQHSLNSENQRKTTLHNKKSFVQR
jgi:hypothetical protein